MNIKCHKILINFSFILLFYFYFCYGIFIISDEWGSGRGYIWKNTLNGYGNLPFVNKIFGAGEAATAWVLSDYSDIASNILNRSCRVLRPSY